jgi:hypothetical protein
MKTIRALLAIATLLFTFIGPVGGQAAQNAAQIASPAPSASSGQAASSGSGTVYLPTVLNGKASTSSFGLIDQDIRSGKLTAEQGLTYKVFAQFSDARLPQKYVGSGVGREGDSIMEDVINYNAAYTLSKTAEATLLPFFIPPDDSRSWFYLSKMQADGQNEQQPQATPASWLKVTTANSKVDIFWLDSMPADAAKAAGLKAEFDRIIWDKLTKLMNKEPMADGHSDGGRLRIYLWNSYVDSDGTTVTFKRDILGITVGTQCDQSPVVIYMPDRLSLSTPGLIQYTTHEFMHAIQFAYTIQSCPKYGWLKEATATWAEDYVYKDAQSEQDTAKKYLNRASVRLDDRTDMHDYGAYLLPYFLTHTVDPSASVIRLMWENAAGTDNSYKAVDDAVNTAQPGMHDFYWPMFLETLWNKSPFTAYYNQHDTLTDSVKQAGGAPIQVSAAGKEAILPLNGELPTGAALFFHLAVADNVSSLTVLNGLGYKLKTGPASEDPWLMGNVKPGDKTYLFDDLSNSDDLKGANLILLIKMAGKNGQPLIMTYPNPDSGLNEQNDGFCLDAQGKIEDMVVILSNSDFAHPDRIMKQQGLPTTIFANNIPCYKLTGTSRSASFTPGSHSDGETRETMGTNLIYQNQLIPDTSFVTPVHVFPDIQLDQVSAQASWDFSGHMTDTSWSTGSGSYTAGAANCMIDIFQGVLAGGPSYRGYVGCGYPDKDTKIDYVYHWVDKDGEHTTPETVDAWSFLDMGWPNTFYDKPNQAKADGSLVANGSYTYDWGDKEMWEWKLTGQKK